MKFQYSINFDNDAIDFPILSTSATIQLELNLEKVEAPEEALRMWAAAAIRHVADGLDEGDLVLDHASSGARMPVGGVIIGSGKDAQFVRPNIHGRSINSVHRLVQRVAKEEGVSSGELAADGFMSAPTMARMMNPETDAGAYVRQFIEVRRDGRRKRLHLNAQGKTLLQLLKAKKVEV